MNVGSDSRRVVERAAANEPHLGIRVLAEDRHLAGGTAEDRLCAAVVARHVDRLDGCDAAVEPGAEPSLFAGWVLVEEAAEGGDMLYQKQQAWPGFLAGYDRVCEGGHVALYRRKGV